MVAFYILDGENSSVIEQYSQNSKIAKNNYEIYTENSQNLSISKKLIKNISKYKEVIVCYPLSFASFDIDEVSVVFSKLAKAPKLLFLNEDLTSSTDAGFVIALLKSLSKPHKKSSTPRIPNIVFGYDKTLGKQELVINPSEAKTVVTIFDLYLKDNLGANKIASYLNDNKIFTKRGNKWSQVAISRLLSNEIYYGNISGTIDESLAIISKDTFNKANNILSSRKDSFSISQRSNDKHVFSSLLKCKECGSSFRRQTRTYKNTYNRWVCCGRNTNGVSYCKNTSIIDEEEFVEAIQDYFASLLEARDNIEQLIVSAFDAKYGNMDTARNEIASSINALHIQKENTIDLYNSGTISKDDLKASLEITNIKLESLNEDKEKLDNIYALGPNLDTILDKFFKDIDKISKAKNVNNALLSKAIYKMEVDKNSSVDILLNILKELDLDENLLA